MPLLEPAVFDEILELLEPFLRDSAAREPRVAILFETRQRKAPDIDYDGGAREVAKRILRALSDYGAIDGTETLWLLLLDLAEQVGDSKKARILALESVVNVPTPALQGNPLELTPLPSTDPHLFISYSRENLAFVKRFAQDLQAQGVPIWIDQVGLKAGTPDWEQALRDAIRTSRGVLLIASPASRKSLYVRDELAIARMYTQAIYPVWADGQEWMECIPMGMGHTQFVDARGERYAAALQTLVAELGASTPTPSVPPPSAPTQPLRNPYKGLRPFTREDREFFFGRGALVTELLDQLKREPRFLAVVGASGSGKSSVIMAGLLPALQNGKLENSGAWVYLPPLVPGNQPLAALAELLEQALPQKSHAAILEDLQHASGRGLHTLARQIIQLQSNRRVVIYVDQFEELFTLTQDERARQQFISLLASAVNDPQSAVTVLLSLRADFYDRPLNYPELGSLLEQHHKAVLPMTLADLYDVVQQPAALVGLQFEANLAAELVYEVRDEIGGLPLLQFALDQLYERRQGATLTLSAYTTLGGVRGALTQHAEQTYQGLPSDDHRRLARALFLRLIEPGATEQDTTRRRLHSTELTLTDAAQTQQLEEVATAFVSARLLVSGKDTLEVAHEALIREWITLRDWLKHAREDVLLLKRLAADAAEWAQHGRDAELVYDDRRLREALIWAERNVPSQIEADFIAAGSTKAAQLVQAEQERQARELALARRAEAAERDRATRARRVAALAGLVGIIAAVTTLISLFVNNEVSQEIISLNTSRTPAHATLVFVKTEVATLAFAATFSALQINQFSTLSMGGVVIQLGTQTPGIFEPTLTQIAVLNNHNPKLPNHQKVDEYDVKMMYVPAGCFFMGSINTSNEQPIHEVCFELPYWIDELEVTRDQYYTLRKKPVSGMTEDELFLPITEVNWIEAKDFCENFRHGNLPTEAQWEYAARGPNSLKYPWGNAFNSNNAVFAENSEMTLAKVGSKPYGVSWVGANDMSGNVWEWTTTIVEDFPYPYATDDGREATVNNLFQRVIRGGSYLDQANLMLLSSRSWIEPTLAEANVGFRCVRFF